MSTVKFCACRALAIGIRAIMLPVGSRIVVVVTVRNVLLVLVASSVSLFKPSKSTEESEMASTLLLFAGAGCPVKE